MLERGERAPAAKEELDSVALAAVVLLEQDVRASLEPPHLLAELLRVLRVGDVVPLDAAVTKSAPPPRLHHDGPAESGSDGKRLAGSRNQSRLRRRDADFPGELERCELVPCLCVRVAAGESQSRRSGEAPAGFREQEDGLFGSGHEQVAITSAPSRETASRGRVASTTTNSRRIRPSSRYSRRRRSSDSSVPSPLRSSRTSAGASR